MQVVEVFVLHFVTTLLQRVQMTLCNYTRHIFLLKCCVR
jgi:hypothetical protein